MPIDKRVGTTPIPEAVRVDEVSATVTYVGLAEPGTLTSEAKWSIQKVDETTGVVVTWADEGRFTQIWDDRAGLVYA